MSVHVLSMRASWYYYKRYYDEAARLFEELRNIDPYRLEHMDVYSNVLYVADAKSRLSFMAHEAVKVDKYRKETCTIIGNYYACKGQHEVRTPTLFLLAASSLCVALAINRKLY
jgi:anaphase-promoting complex subunit 8